MADEKPWEKYINQGTTNPVAPTGLQQTASRVGEYQSANNGQLPPWLNGDYANSTRNWVSGANMQGTDNGWDYTEGFNAKMQEGYDKAAEEGTLRQYHDFANSKGTGIVQFDYVSDADPNRKYRFGDIYEDGEFVGNLYDEKAMGFSKETANILLGEFMLDRRTKSEVATASDSDARRQREIDAVRERNQTEIPKAWQALETQGKIEDKQESFQEGLKDDILSTLAGATGGAATGGGAGAVVGAVPGAVVGGVIGGVVGGVGGFLNRDELSQAAARATVVTGMADEEFGRVRAMFTGVHQWSGVAGKTLMPLSNTVRGIYDATEGTTGDGVEEFHAVDDDGSRKASPLWIAADLGASVGDSLLQFASPLGRQLYTAQMSANIIGQTGQLATTGQTFDDRRGGFDNIFKDDQGNADLSSGAAGIMSIGIDVVQLGMVRGLSKSVAASREQANLVDKVGAGRLRNWVSERTPYALGGTKGLEAGQKVVHVGGAKFIVDDAGKVVEGSRRMTMAMLAPSEALPYISSSMMARRAAVRRSQGPMAVTTDDYYRAATSLANGQRKVTSAFLNSFGEASEEAAQAILEPLSHDGRIDPWQVMESAAYGGAMGLGMSLGTTMRAPNQDQRLRAQAEANYLMTFGTEMPEGMWEQLSQADKQARAMMGTQAQEIGQKVFARIKDEQSATLTANVPELARLRDAQLTAQESALAKISAKTDGTFVIGQLEFAGEMDENGELLPGSMPNNAVGSSATQVAQNLRMHLEGLQIQRDWLQRRIKELQDKGAKGTATEEDVTEQAQRTRQLATAELTISMSTALNESVADIAAELAAHVENGDRVAAEASVREMNALLLRAYNRQIPTFPGVEGELTDEQRNALARAATLVFVREPKDQSGSFLSMVPQASMQLSWSGSDNYLQISHSVLAAIGGDYDGDKIRQQAQLLLDDQQFENSRSGSSLMGVATGPMIGTRDYESYNVANMAKALAAGEKAAELATHHLRAITKAIHRRYDGRMPAALLDAALLRFQDDVAGTNPKARQRLIDMLAEVGGEGIMARARQELSNEWLWIDQVVASNLQAFQSAYALYRPQMGTIDTESIAQPDTTVEAPHQMTATAAMKKRMRRQAATLGQTLGLWTDGPGMFRAFQKLHYSVFGAGVASGEGRDLNALEQLVQIYEAMGARVSTSELEAIQSKDVITGRVLVWLEAMGAEAARTNQIPGLTAANAAFMIGSLQAQDYERDPATGEIKFLPGKISMAQLLLKRSVQMDQVENAKILDRDPQLQAKHARLLAMTRAGGKDNPVNAERALLEVFGASPLYGLLGESATPLGAHLTPDQFRRKIESMHEVQRRQEIRALQADPAYVRTQGPKGETATKSLPYTMDEFAEGVHPYRVMIDALVNVSRYELTADENGRVSGEKADRDKRTSTDYRTAHGQIAAALIQFESFSPRDNESRVDKIRRMFVENPDQARVLMQLLPDSAIQATYALDQDGNAVLAPWLYEALAETDAAKAEMIYWRGLLIAQWNALGGRSYVADDDIEGEQGRKFSAMTRRMHRVMYRLSKADDLAYLEFMDALYSADDLGQFMELVNRNPGWRGDQAPLLAWIDDTAEFDMDKAGGGWAKNLSGSELRAAIADLRSHTERLIEDLKQEHAALLEDQEIFIELDRYGTAEETQRSREKYAQMEAAIKLAGTRMEAVGPGAMVMQGVASLLGFFPSAHTKGQNPSAYRPFGLFDAGRDGFGFLTSFERYMGSLTTVNIDDVSNNPNLLLHGDVRTMDEQGNTVEWQVPSVEKMVELLRDPKTRSLARAMLFPTVSEATPDGRVTSKFLIGKSVKGLLNSSMHQQLFAQSNGRLTHEAAMLYATAVNAGARRWGGTSSDFVRAVNDLVIARTTSSRKVLTADQADRMWNEAAEELAQLLQMAGSIRAMERPAAGFVGPEQESVLTSIRDAVKSAARNERARVVLGIPGAEGKMLAELTLEQFITERKEEGAQRLASLATELAAAPNPEAAARIQARLEMEQRSIEQFEEKVQLLMSNDPFGLVVDRFSIQLDTNGNVALESLGAQREVLAYIRSTGTLLATRAPKILTTLTKLQNQLIDSAQAGSVNLTGAEWQELSAAVIAMKIDDQTSMAAPDLALPVYPDETKERERRYMDPSWAYLVEQLLTPGNPLLEEAADLHIQAGRFGIATEQSELIRHIGDVVLDQRKLGDWTTDIPRQSIQANERLDSASAEPAIAMAGNPPKRQVTISSATRRTMLKPDESLLSKATLSLSQLNGDISDAVLVDLATTGERIPGHRMPLAQLNNRFAQSAVLTFQLPNGQTDTVDLMDINAVAQVGHTWPGDATVAASGYKVITVERLQHGVERALSRMAEMGVELAAVQIDVSFFHPDSQPAEPQWMRNVYFEGTSFATVGDDSTSLNNTLWFAPGSLSPELQAAALDASKLGRPAIKVTPPADPAAVSAAEATWDEPFGFVRMLRAKTALVMDQDFGAGKLDAHLYNAVYMNMKLRHFVRGTIEGQPVLWTAEQVIAHQMSTGLGVRELIPDAELWIPSDNVLREMLGEQGTQGTSEYNDFFQPNPANIRLFDRATPEMAAKYGGAGQVALEDTVVAARGRQTQLLVSSHISDATRNAYDMRIQHHNSMRAPVHADRSQINGFDPKANTERMAARAGRALKTESLSLDWPKLGMPWVGVRETSSAMTEVMLQQYERMKESDGNRTGWIYEENVASAPMSGLLSNVDLGNSELRPGLQIAPGDPVAVITSSFDSQKRIDEVIDYLVGRGADIILVTDDSATENRTYAVLALTERHGYDRVPGASHAYAPPEYSERYQTVRARESLLTETLPITMRNRLAVFLTDGEYITENAAWVVPKNSEREQFRNVSVGLNLVPTDFLADINVPRGAQVDATKATVLALLQDDRGLALLKSMAGEEQLAETHVGYNLDEAITRLQDRLRKNEGTVLPVAGDSFGTGDLIPLIDVNGNILFYRHGYSAPKNRDAVTRMWSERFEGELEPRGVAIFPSEQEPLATAHTGTVVRFFDRPGYGLAAELQIPLQVFGDKLQLEWQGMKYIVGPMPGTYDLPEHGFFPGQGFDLIADRDSSDSKEAVGERLNNFRNAFAFLGIDFGQDLQQFFGLNAADTLTVLNSVAANAKRLSVRQVHDMLTNTFVEPAILEALSALDAELGGQLQTSTWLDDLGGENYQAAIAHAALLYLMTPGAHPEHILQSGGLNDPNATNPKMGARLMPQLFTQIFDRAPLGSPLRNEMFSRFNRQLYNPNDDGTGYCLLPDWPLEVTTRDGDGNLRTKHGTLQMPEVHSSGDNPLKNGMAFSETDRQPAGWHSQSITWAAFGAETVHSRRFLSDQGYLENEGIYRFNDAQDGGVWRMLTDTTEADRGFETWRMPGPMELELLAMEREAMAEYRKPLDMDAWDSDAKGASRRREYETLRTQVRQALGLSPKLDVVLDFWVRQMLGRPGGLVEDESGNIIAAPPISVADAIDTMNLIKWNVDRNYLPIVGGSVPALSLIDLQMLFRADGNWAPRSKVGGTADLIERKDWEAWVEVSLGATVLESRENFDPMFLLATDAFMHTYRGATASLLHLPVSLDQLKELNLLDPNTNQMYTSLSRDVNTLLKDPVILNEERASLRQLMGGERINGRFVGKMAPASAAAKHKKRRDRWRYDTGTPFPTEGTVADLRAHGQSFIHKTQQTTTFWRVLINLRVGTALINPALWLSAGPESWFRGIMDRAANTLTMSGTTGRVASLQAGVSERGAERAAQRAAELTAEGKQVDDVTAQGGLLNALTSGSRYTRGQQGMLQELYDTLGDRLDFRGMISRETYYLNTRHSGAGRFERASEQYARLGAAFQDPTVGGRTKTIARRYVEGALRYILSQPTTTVMSVESLVAALKADPAWLQKNLPDAHTAGLNSVAYFRSLNQTLPNKIARGIYEPLGSHSNGAVQAFGNLFLRIPLLFSGYASSVALNLTGMQGFFDAMSMTLDSRNNKFTRWVGKASARMNEKEFNPDTWNGFDMSDVLEGVDLSQSFLRSGATLSGLALMGMMMGGLTGEDEEMKRRRRQAELLGAPLLYDPRDLANAVANGEAVFLDATPGVGAIFDALYGVQAGGDGEEDRRVMANLPWVLRAFASPVLGVARFLETGDPRQVRWGFEDALSSFPLLNRFMYNEVVNTYDGLMTDAAKEAEKGTFEGDVSAMKLIVGGIATYENMLFENSFLNTTYVSLDRYDRDPFKVVEVTDTGEIRQELTPNGSQPYATGGLQDYVDENGVLNESYLSRDYAGRSLRQLSESRLTLAAVGSILSMDGWKSDFLRYNMAPKTRSFELPEITSEEARAAIADLATEQLGTAQFMTPQELEPLIKQRYQNAGIRWDQAAVEEEAKVWAKQLQQEIKAYEQGGATTDSVISEEQKALLARADAASVLQGIVSGTLTLDDPAMRGFYITLEDRKQIQEDWQKDLIQEGVDFGLTETQARYRMYRIWNGEGTDVGIKDILWSDKINYSNSLEYRQLNSPYVAGPDGMPIATGFTRGGILAGFGVIPTWQWGADAHGGAKAMGSGALGQDMLLNVQDFAVGINTGARALEPVKESNRIPGDREILEAIQDVEKAIEGINFSPSSAYDKTAKGGSGFGSYRRYGGGRGGYGGGGGGSTYYSRLNPLPNNQAPYGNTVPFINTSNPIIRRSNIRRERVTSERGRLNQWQ